MRLSNFIKVISVVVLLMVSAGYNSYAKPISEVNRYQAEISVKNRPRNPKISKSSKRKRRKIKRKRAIKKLQRNFKRHIRHFQTQRRIKQRKKAAQKRKKEAIKRRNNKKV